MRPIPTSSLRRALRLLLATAMLLGPGVSRLAANPNLNINTEDLLVYDVFEASLNSLSYCMTIKPYVTYKAPIIANHYRWIRRNLSVEDGPGYYLKPLRSLDLQFYYTQESRSFLEGRAGLRLEKGANFFLFQDGYLSLGDNFLVYYQFKETFRSDEKKFDLQRAYGKINFYKFAITGGVDNVNLGPGEYGLLLSNNARPFPLVKFGTEEQLEFLGKWEFVLLNGWLMEKRGDYDNPMILAFRLAWKPFDYVELGVTRAALHGGEGRKAPEWYSYFDLFISSRHRSSSDRFDRDALGGYDISVYLPFHLLTDLIEITKFYFQVAGSDLLAPWTHENNRAFQYGVLFSIRNNILRFEYVETAPRFYLPPHYNAEDWAFKGLSLGYPTGADMKTVQFKHRFFVLDYLSFEYRVGWFRQPLSGTGTNVDRYSVSLIADGRVWELIIQGYVRYDWTAKGYDTNPLPDETAVSTGEKSFLSAGVGVTWRL